MAERATDKPRGRRLVRNKSDYAVIAVMFAGCYVLGEWASRGRTPPAQAEQVWSWFSLIGWALGFEVGTTVHAAACWVGFYVITAGALFGSTLALWRVMKAIAPGTPTTYLNEQALCVATNFLLLPLYQVFWDWTNVQGWTKVSTERLEPLTVLADIAMWMLGFELAWYTQHRAMHDNKLLWEYGHKYHHGWKKPEHMIGVTNFAFDHVVETFVTMSSSYVPAMLFPCNFFVAKILSFLYMLYAVLVHWDYFHDISAYHLNHHYLVRLHA